MSKFEDELAELDKVTGINIADAGDSFILNIKSQTVKRVVLRSWNKPKPRRLAWYEWLYIVSLMSWIIDHWIPK